MAIKAIHQLTQQQAWSAIEHRLNFNPDAISLPVLGIGIGAGHTAFPGDKVWCDSMLYPHALTLAGWADSPSVPRNLREVYCEGSHGVHQPEDLFPSQLLAAKSRRSKVLKLYRKRRKWMRIYREGVRDMDKVIRSLQ